MLEAKKSKIGSGEIVRYDDKIKYRVNTRTRPQSMSPLMIESLPSTMGPRACLQQARALQTLDRLAKKQEYIRDECHGPHFFRNISERKRERAEHTLNGASDVIWLM